MSSVVDALLVYAEPLATGAHAVVVGDAEGPVAERLLELGARSILVFDADPARAASAARTAPRGVTVRPLVDDLDVRDGAFDIAIVPDIAELNDPRGSIARLRRAVVRGGAIIALGRAKLPDGDDGAAPFGSDLAPATLEYAELYDLFATQFDEVALVGVVPFAGVVFAELGSEDEANAVSVDTRLVAPPPPSVFVIVAGGDRARTPLDPYAIVQVTERTPAFAAGPPELETELAASILKGELLSAQLEEARERLFVADARTKEVGTRLERAGLERDVALTRAMELEAVLGAAQQTIGALERRLLETERAVIDREDRLATFEAQALQVRSSVQVVVDPELVARLEHTEAALAQALAELSAYEETIATRSNAELPEIVELTNRVQRGETALALSLADVAQMAEAHGIETAAYEAQLRERARLIASLEKELVRREHFVKELVVALEESRESGGVVYQTAEPLSLRSEPSGPRTEPGAGADELRTLKGKLDELAGEVARREGELVARAWRITELENELASHADADDAASAGELARVMGELDALRQALAQEHAARLAAESGEELKHARAELARQAVLLEQMRGRQD